MRNDFYPPPHYPPHMPPHPYDLPPVIRPPHVSPKKDQFGRDISKRMEYEDSRRHRRGGDRHPHHDDHVPIHRQPWDPRRWPHPFNEGRRSSEDASGSPTPPANLESGSSEEEKSRRKKSKVCGCVCVWVCVCVWGGVGVCVWGGWVLGIIMCDLSLARK